MSFIGMTKEIIDAMDKQFRRIEKLFGYTLGSNHRGI